MEQPAVNADCPIAFDAEQQQLVVLQLRALLQMMSMTVDSVSAVSR